MFKAAATLMAATRQAWRSSSASVQFSNLKRCKIPLHIPVNNA